MSVRLLGRVLAESEAEGAARLVLIVLADAAQDDGITWVPQRDIAAKARISEGHSRACIKKLAEDGELETAKVQRGRSRINVYRLRYAVAAVDADRLPFELPAGAFSRPQDSCGGASDDRRSDESTTADLTAFSGGLSISSNRKGLTGRGEIKISPVRDEPPAIKKVGGQNEPLNALMIECGVDAGNEQRVRWAVAALNGKAGAQGIRHLFWLEACRYAEAHPEFLARLDEVRAEPEAFSEALVAAIRRKAAKYRETMKGARLTPTALRDWWLDLELQRKPDAGMTREEILAFRG